MFRVIAINKKGIAFEHFYTNEGLARVCAEQFEQYGSKVVLFEKVA